MRKDKKLAALLTVAVVYFCAAPLYATLVPLVTPEISGTSNATLIVGGPYDGWYLYEITIQWDMDSQGLSHWDVILKTGCASPDHLIEFDTPGGHSTTVTEPDNPMAMGWTGYFYRENGDPALGILDPVVKYNNPFYPPDAQPDEQGYGTFSFYANIIPEYGTYPNALVAKAGTLDPVYGELTGAYPSCTIIPEPATLCLLGLGGLALLRKRRV